MANVFRELTGCQRTPEVGRHTADLLQLPAFRQMNISFDRLSSTGKILSGFNGATIVTIGDIALPVKAGPVVQQVLFSVVETWARTMPMSVEARCMR